MNVSIDFLSPSVNINRSFSLSAEIKSATQAYCELVAEAADSMPEVIAASKKIEALLITDTASGSIASFPDGADGIPVKSLVVNVEPNQDLHGYDSPWPAGGGGNKLPLKNGTYTVGTTVTLTIENGKVTMSGTASTPGGRLVALSDNFTLEAGTYFIKANSSGGDAIAYINRASDNAALNSGPDRNFTISEDTVVFAGVNVINGSNYSGIIMYPMLNVGSTAEPYSPYSNICPITGWTGANVVRDGFNVWDEEWEVGNIDGTGQNASANDRIRSKNYISVKGGLSYYVVTPKSIIVHRYASDKSYLGNTYYASSSVVALADDVAYIRFRMDTSYGTTYNSDISINYPSTDHDYHAYAGQVIPITWQTEAGTVYGGKVDVTNGVLTISKVFGSKLLSDSDWSDTGQTLSNTRHYRYYGEFFGAKIKNTDKAICNVAPYVYDSSDTVHFYPTFNTQQNQSRVEIWLPNGTPSSTVIEVCAELDTAVNIQLTPQQVNTLLGQNNIFADTGNTEVEYVADTKLYIQKMIAAALNS